MRVTVSTTAWKLERPRHQIAGAPADICSYIILEGRGY